MKIPVAIDPLETAELDFCLEALKRAERIWERVVEKARADEDAAHAKLDPGAVHDPLSCSACKASTVETSKAALARIREELVGYVPGSGPIFTVGLIPGEKRATLIGMVEEEERAEKAGDTSGAAAASFRYRRAAVKAAVRGHRGLKRRDGSEAPFASEPMQLAGTTVTVPTDAQVEAYAASRMLPDLAAIVLDFQRLGGDEKNG